MGEFQRLLCEVGLERDLSRDDDAEEGRGGGVGLTAWRKENFKRGGGAGSGKTLGGDFIIRGPFR